MSTNGASSAEDVDMADCEQEKVVTMMDVLQEQQEFEEDADAVLGASDDKNCTYSKGYIKRQAIYACITCCEDVKTDPSKRAGVCLACSLSCHENHELIELYTKRNFRCDCGNTKFNSHPCQFVPEKPDLNEDNQYNQNFSGLYCTCHRPYPDPEFPVEDEMIQCIICEDWLHACHLEATVPTNEQYTEMICKGCMDKNEFLHDYSDIAIPTENDDVDVINATNTDISMNKNTNECNGNVEREMSNEKASDINKEDDIKNDMTVETTENENTETSELPNDSKFNDENVPKEITDTNEQVLGENCMKNKEGDTLVELSPEQNKDDTNVLKDNATAANGEVSETEKEEEPMSSTMESENETKAVSGSDKTANEADIINPIETNIEDEENDLSKNSSDKIDKEEDKLKSEEENGLSKNSSDKIEQNIEAQSTDNEQQQPSKEISEENKENSSEKNEQINEDQNTEELPQLNKETSGNADNVNSKTSEETDVEKTESENVENPESENVEKAEPENLEKAESENIEHAESENIEKPDGVENSNISTSNINEEKTETTVENMKENSDQTKNNDDNVDATLDTIEEKNAEESSNETVPETNDIDEKDKSESTENKILETQNDIEMSTDKQEEKVESPNNTKDNILETQNDIEMSADIQEEKVELPNDFEGVNLLNSELKEVTNENGISDNKPESADAELTNKLQDTKDSKRKLSTEESAEEVTTKKPKFEESEACIRPKGVKRRYKGATFWPSNFRQKLCTCNECTTMYKDLSVLFLIDPEDTVFAYETLGKEKTDGTPASQYEKGLQALSSLDRIQQINALTEYNRMRDKLLDFLKSFKDRKEIVKEEDIKAFFAGMKPKREPDGVYFCR